MIAKIQLNKLLASLDASLTLPSLTVSPDTVVDLMAGVRWQDQHADYQDWCFITALSWQRDQLPAELKQRLLGCRTGDQISLDCAAGELIAAADHPLAARPLQISLHVTAVRRRTEQATQAGYDIVQLICNNGPGRQSISVADYVEQRQTLAFARTDESDDGAFFSIPDLAPFWDDQANQVVAGLYRQLIPSAALVLDLMAGAHTPLQDAGVSTLSIHCAGLNRAELAFNPMCSEYRELNVNLDLPLPYPDQQYDCVLIHAAIEYAVHPMILFREIARILKPHGRLIVTFSPRCVAAKATAIWRELDAFERHALLRYYLKQSGAWHKIGGFSLRGLQHAGADSDPVHALWAQKTAGEQ